MTTGSETSNRLSFAGTWRCHVAAVAGALVVNGALALFLSAWSRPSSMADRPPLRSVPLEVVELETEEMEIVRRESPENVAPPEPPAVEPALPAPDLPDMTVPTVRLEAPQQPGADAIRIPEILAELPAFVVRPDAQPPIGRIAPEAVPEPRPAPRGAATRGPMLIQPPDLADYYPRRALMRGTTGRTTVRLTISAEGRVTDVQVLSSTPEGVFDVAARRVSRTLRFRPALRRGKPVPVTVSLNLIWRIQD